MSKLLRDQFLKDLKLDAHSLKKINNDLIQVAQELDLNTPERISSRSNDIQPGKIFNYTLRYDGKGYALNDFEKILEHFEDAQNVERFVFTFNILQLNIMGQPELLRKIQIGFDRDNETNCYLVVEDDNENWVNSSFLKIKERMNRYRIWHSAYRYLFAFLLQIIGVLFIFILSFYVISKLSLQPNNNVVFIYIAFLFLFSAIWNPIFIQLAKLIKWLFPLVSFKPTPLHWFAELSLGTIFITSIGFLLKMFYSSFSLEIVNLFKIIKQ